MTVADAVARELLKNPELEQFSKMVEEFGAGMKTVADSPAVRGLAVWLKEIQGEMQAFSDSPAGREFFTGLKNFVENGLPVAPSGAYVVTLNALPVAPSVEDIVDPVIPEAPHRRPGFAPWDS